MVDDGSVNREKTCPLLLRMFCSSRKHNNVIEYSKGKTPVNELQVYTWLDATLKELASLVKQVNPESRKRGTFFDFALVFPDQRIPTYKMRELGTVSAGFPSDTDRIMLKDVQFSIGDMIDVAITLPMTLSDDMKSDSSRRIKPTFDSNRRRPNRDAGGNYRDAIESNNTKYRYASQFPEQILANKNQIERDNIASDSTERLLTEKRRVEPY